MKNDLQNQQDLLVQLNRAQNVIADWNVSTALKVPSNERLLLQFSISANRAIER
jgi:hypothetical protein